MPDDKSSNEKPQKPLRGELKKSETALREEQLVEFWKSNRIFEKSVEREPRQTENGGEFVFYDGPPFATGLPHMGHLLASAYKDAIGRYKTMQGYRVPRRWGWDCHGLPIESLVEKKLGLKSKKEIEVLGVEKFNAEARASVTQFVTDWEWYVDRIGRWVDFKNSYKTMDTPYMESVWWALKQLNEKGLLYEGNKVLMYCTHCETPLAKAEIQMDNTYKDVTEEAVTVKFKVKNPVKYGLPENTFILAWTTTPWTLPGNVGLAIRQNEDAKYFLFRKEDENIYYISSANYFGEYIGRLFPGKEHDPIQELLSKPSGEFCGHLIEEVKAENLVNIEYEPLYDVPAVNAHLGKKHVVMAADFVTITDGTGVVHTAVMYGEDDYNLGKKEGLPMVQLLTANGTYNEKAPTLVQGMFYKKGGKYVLEDLAKRGLVFQQAPNKHSYPHCYRCGESLIYNAVSSWFLGITQVPKGETKTVKERMIEENNEVKWVPSHLQHGRFQHILETAPDWTISRNRYWATPLPIWKCSKCPERTVLGSKEELKARAIQPVPDDLDLHRPYIDQFTLTCEMCNGEMKRTPEVVDCWFESGSMPFAEVHYPFENKMTFERRAPGDFIAEYIAQTRTWFYYMHAMGVLLFNRKAFKNVTSTGTILAADGEKMSKSKGNYTDPKINLDLYGADALRFYLMGSPVMSAEDTNFRDEDLKETHSRIINMLWNSYTFYDLYAKNVVPTVNAEDSKNILDQWILVRLSQMVSGVTTSLDGYETVPACRFVRDFVEDYSTWYLRRSRDRIKDEGEDKQYALATMRTTMLTLARVIAPLMPFVAESIHQGLGGVGESVHLAEWPTIKAAQDASEQQALIVVMSEARNYVSLALEQRSHAKIKVRQPLSKLTIAAGTPFAMSQHFLQLATVIADEVNVKFVVRDEAGDKKAVLDITITPELEREGHIRDLIRAVQELRKNTGLVPSDVPILTVSADAYGKVFVEGCLPELIKAANLRSVTFADVQGVDVQLGATKVAITL